MKKEEAEMIGQCFIDDSICATNTADSMQDTIRMHEKFCNFHKVMMHKTKSEYITINGKGKQIRWNPKGKEKQEGNVQNQEKNRRQRRLFSKPNQRERSATGNRRTEKSNT